MKLIDMIFALFLGVILSDIASAKVSSRYEGGNRIIAPFGFKTRQPPSGSSIRLLDVKLGLTAQQVCGYTDWTTTQLHLTKTTSL